MFARLGSFAVRFRRLIIAAWVVTAIALTLAAPNIDDVAVSDQRAFLPASAPSLEAGRLMRDYFPDRYSPSSAVVVIDAGQGNRIYPEGGTEAEPAGASPAAGLITELTEWLTGVDAPVGVDRVLSPTLGDEQTRAGLVSPDGQVALVLVRFEKVGTEPVTKQAMAAVQERLDRAPAGLDVYMTGDGPILAAYNQNSKGSVDSTTWITIVLVVVILVVIYRSPVSPFIPLITIALAYVISRAVVAFLGAGALTISMYTNVFLVVVLFGAGTDYCLFLISRFREEMTDAPTSAPAVKTTVRSVGETIASSAGTVIVGLAMMTFAELGLYNTTGPAIAIGVAIALLAGLTLTPAMLAILGDRAFWPRKARHMRDSGYWYSWAGRVVRRPLVALLVPVVVLMPFAVYGGGLVRDFDLLADLPKEDETRQGFQVLAEHFGPGQMQPLNVIALGPAGFDTPAGLAKTAALAVRLAALPHVELVRSFTGSLPDPATLSVADQLRVQAEAVREGIAPLEQALLSGRGSGPELANAAGGLVRVYGYLVQLAQGYPEVLAAPGYQQAMAALSELNRLAQAVGRGTAGGSGDGLTEITGETLATAQRTLIQVDALAGGLESLQAGFASRPEAIMLPDLYLESNKGLRALRDAYISPDGAAARLQVVLDTGPYTPEAVATVQEIRLALAGSGVQGGVEGNSSVLLDLGEASDRDMNRAYAFVLGGVFLVLVLLLRALVAPVYLILTILLSYSATLGVTRVLFVDVLGAPGVTWWVPMFMFVMLVALGMDYNIFLIGRVKEEVVANGIRDGTRLALARTGGIITSAGIIMAGTFASMLSSSLLGLLQIGFAVAFGVLLDTFVVRTTLVPALTVLLGRWAWWPRRGPGGKAAPD